MNAASDSYFHHIVTYIYQPEGNESFLGFDASVRAASVRSIELARDTAGFVGTKPIGPLHADMREDEILLLLPVYSQASVVSLRERREHFKGSLVGAFSLKVLMEQSAQNRFTSIKVFDVTDVPDVSHTNAIVTGEIAPIYRFGNDAGEMFKTRRSLSFAGREWVFMIAINEADLMALGHSETDWHISILGFLLSVISSLWVFTIVSSRDKARQIALNLTRDLRQANNDLRLSNNELSQFAHVASDHLHTPVRDIETSVTLLHDALANRMSPHVSDYLNQLHDSSERMANMVHDLLIFARVDREWQQFQLIDLNRVLGNLRQLHRKSENSNSAMVDVGSMPVVSGNQDQLECLFTNLLSNAIKYREPNRPLIVQVAAKLQGEQWQIRFSDNGMGIDSDFHQKVFTPFQRLCSQESITGTGLGLSICRRIAKNHGGDIEIEHSTCEGTTFLISLPAVESVSKAA